MKAEQISGKMHPCEQDIIPDELSIKNEV